MKITELDLQENGKKYCCKDANEIFEVNEGNLIPATRNFSMAELFGMEFEEVDEMKNPYKRVNIGKRFYAINRRGEVESLRDVNDYIDNEQFDLLNYFNSKNYAEYIAFKENLMRRMDKFAWNNNAKVINWDDCSEKYCIKFSNARNKFIIEWSCSYQLNDIYFTSREIAEKALEEFKDDLIKLYTWKFDV